MPVEPDSDAEKDLEEFERELIYQRDELFRNTMDVFYQAAVDVAHKEVELGLKTQGQIEEELRAEEVLLFEEFPQAYNCLKSEKDEDGWFGKWLPQNPEFLELFMGNHWPDWLPKPPEEDAAPSN